MFAKPNQTKMTLQLFYPMNQEQKFADDLRATRGIGFTTYLPDGSEVYSIRTDQNMAANLVVKPVSDWNQLVRGEGK